MDERWQLIWTYLATGIVLWMLGLFWVDAFDEPNTYRAEATVLTAPPSLPFRESNAEVQYLGQTGLQKEWITTTYRLNPGDTIPIIYGPNIETARDTSAGKPPRWVGKLVLVIGTVVLLLFINMVYVWYLQD